MGLFDGFFDSLFNNNMVGWIGETYTEIELGVGKLFGHKGKMLRNIYIPKDDGTTSEIDVLYITPKGIFVIESKNYSGWIFGDAKSQYWTASLPNKQKNRFYNPIKQNQSHIKWLGNYLKDSEIPLFSIIAFSERCTLKKVPELEDIYVVNRNDLFYAIEMTWKKKPDVLSDEKVLAIWNDLKTMTNADAATKAAHVDNINTNYKKQDEDKSIDDNFVASYLTNLEAFADVVTATISENVILEPVTDEKKCPRCGSTLVLRVAKKGANAGNQFYGCSAFPKCRYIEN